MIGDSVLGEVVGADFFGSHAATNSLAASGVDLSFLFFLLDLVKFGSE